MKNILLITLLLLIISCARDTNNNPSDCPADDTIDYYAQAQKYLLDANYDTAMIYLNQALEVTDSANYQKMADIYILRSSVFGNLAQFETSMEDAHTALTICEQHHLIGNKTLALLSIGKVHYLMYNDEQAETFMLRAKTIAETNELQKELMQITVSLGELYNVVGRGDEALPLLMQTLDLANQLSDTLNIIKALRTLGCYYVNLNRGEKQLHEIDKKHQLTAKKYLDEALQLALIKKATRLITDTKMGLIRWCRVEENFAKALEYAQEILKDADPNNHALLIQVYDHLVTIYACLGDAENSTKCHQIFYNMMIRQSDEKLHRSLQEMEVKYETAEKELEIIRQQAEISRHQTLRLVYIGGLIAAGLLLALLVHTVRLRTKRNRELAEMNATKDRFFAIISHDLKNPTIAQRDALQMLIDFSDHWNTETLTKFYYELLKSADSQIELLYNLLNWAQVQTGRMPYRPVPFDITTALRSDIVLIKNMAERKNITFDIQMPETAIITGDDNMLVTVVRNLLTNAVKFTAAGGTVTLNIIRTGDPCGRPPSPSPSPSPSLSLLSSHIISITDTGAGMSPEQIQNLFHIDRHHSRKGTAGESGSGLGLMVCKELVEKHGSTLYVESTEGEGSRFWFEIG